MYGNYRSKPCGPEDLYRDYRFNIVYECEITPYYFTEKLCNCFANKVVPINYGCTNLASFGFDTNGVIQVNSHKDIIDILNSDFDFIEEYNKRLEAINYNYTVVNNYRCVEDSLYIKYKDLLESL